MRRTDPLLLLGGSWRPEDADLAFGLSSPTPDAAHNPTDDEACGEYEEKDHRPGCGDGPGQKGDIHIFHVLENEDQRQNPESDTYNKSDHVCPPIEQL